MVIKAKRIYEPTPKKEEQIDLQKIIADAFQSSISKAEKVSTWVSLEIEKENKIIERIMYKIEDKIKSMKIDKSGVTEDVYNQLSGSLKSLWEHLLNIVNNHEHDYLTSEDKYDCINIAETMVNEAVLKFDNLFKPFLEQLNTKSDKQHTHIEFEELKKEIDENEEELEQAIDMKADKKHTHKVRDVEKLQEKLDKKADKEHKHDEYATRQELEFIAMQKARWAGWWGHVIQWSWVVSAQRSNLNFIGATVTDDPNNNATIVTVTWWWSWAVDSVNWQTGVVVLDQDDIGDGATYKQYSDTEKTKLAGIEAWADITDATNVNAAGAVMNSDYTPSHSILVQQSWTWSPAALQIWNNTLVGRLSWGGSDIDDLSTTDVRTLLSISNVDNTSDATKNSATATLTNKTLTSPILTTPVLWTPASWNLSSCTADWTDAVWFRNIPQNSKSAAYTLVLADSGKHIYHPSADTTPRIWTIPANSSVAYPIGTAITFVNDTSAWVITIAITTDTLVLAWAGTTGSRTLAANGVATAIKITSTRRIINWTGLT